MPKMPLKTEEMGFALPGRGYALLRNAFQPFEPTTRAKSLARFLLAALGGGGIRTHGTGLAHTRFPSVLLRPLGHSSKEGGQFS